MDRQLSPREQIDLTYEHVVGKESSAWSKWWAVVGYNPLSPMQVIERASSELHTALMGALLSLGAPPHPDIMTKDLFEIRLDSIPRHPKSMWRRDMNVLDMEYKRQHHYNKQLNAFAHKHGLVHRHKTQDPAQFRKLMAAYVLHACNRE